MRGLQGSIGRALVLATGLTTVLLTGASGPALGQTGICEVLTLDELASIVGATFGEGTGSDGGCFWQAATASGASVTVNILENVGTFAEMQANAQSQGLAVEELTVAGKPALRGTQTTDSGITGIVALDLGDHAAGLLVGSTDAAVDVLGAASALMELAAGRLGTVVAPSQAPPTHPDACSIFSNEELSTVMGEPLTSEGDAGRCDWRPDAARESLKSVGVGFDSGGLTAIRTSFPGGDDVTVAGHPGYLFGSDFGSARLSIVSVDLGPVTMNVSVNSDDPALDADAVALQLMELAFSRGLAVGPEPSALPSPCAILSPADIAGAVGTKVKLDVQDYETSCWYSGGQGNGSVQVIVSALEPGTLDILFPGNGGEEIQGVGDEAWWVSSGYPTLYAREGDRTWSVSISLGKEAKDARLQAMARVMLELLFTRG